MYILSGHTNTFSLFSVFLAILKLHEKSLWGFELLKSLNFLIFIFLLDKKMQEENGIRVWLIIVMILTLMKYCEEYLSMYLVYIYNSFILNVFLTFLLFSTFIFVVIRFKLVLAHLCGRIKELYLSGKTCQRHADLLDLGMLRS